MDDEILVSINCLVYNHAEFLRECLNGFVMQKTNFKFEVLIHDDASTDGSQDIIREYEEKYPDIIKPIYQKENQYSKHIGINKTYQYPRVKGKYIAMCEGDDCWIDEKKLQKQFDYMESHPNCTLCFTNAFYKYGETVRGKVVPSGERAKFFKGEGDYNVAEMVLLDFVPTASLFFPKYLVEDYPVVRKSSFDGDTLLRVYATSKGYAHYFDETTCIYRKNVANSATAVWTSNKENNIVALERLISLFEDLDELTEYKYHDAFEYNIVAKKCRILQINEDYDGLKSKQYKDYIKTFGKKRYLLFCLNIYIPKTYKCLNTIYKRIRKIKN